MGDCINCSWYDWAAGLGLCHNPDADYLVTVDPDDGCTLYEQDRLPDKATAIIDHITEGTLSKYRNSIPRKAFIEAMEQIKAEFTKGG